MPRHTPAPGAVVVVTCEDDRYADARRTATALAAKRGRRLILYDWDAPSFLSEPLPTWWSSEGWDRRFPDRLDASQLDAVGRSSIADQVRVVRAAGVEAFGWLPSDHGPDALASYAEAQRASVVVIPRELGKLHGFEALVNGTAAPADELRSELKAELVIA